MYFNTVYLVLLVFVISSCSGRTNNDKITNEEVKYREEIAENNVNKGNTFVYENNVEITLPYKFYIESSIIYNDKGEKIGEFAPGLITPLKSISFSEILEMYKYGGEFQAKYSGDFQPKEFTISFGDEDDDEPDILRIDSIQLTNYKWYFIVIKDEYEGDEWGYWNRYEFITFEKDKILFITFYNKDLKNDKSDYFINIIKTVKIR